jgi:hypothetical protein
MILMSKMNTTDRKFNEEFYGSEPDWPIISKTDLIKAFNWYSCMGTEDVATIVAFMEREGFSLEEMRKVQKAEGRFQNSHMAVARMFVREIDLPEDAVETLKKRIKEVLSEPEVQKTNVVQMKSFEGPTMFDKAVETIDRLYDLAVLSAVDFKVTIDIESLPAADRNKLRRFYDPKIKELVEALGGKDEELLQSYGTTKSIKRQLNFLYGIFGTPVKVPTAEVIQHAAQKRVEKAVRKPRKKKLNLTLLKYMKEHTELGLKSISPLTVHEASNILLVYCPKYEKLTVYYAQPGARLAFKRTSVINFDEKKSFSKKIGRAKGLMDLVKAGGKREILKAVNEVKTKPGPASSLINADVLLMRAFV